MHPTKKKLKIIYHQKDKIILKIIAISVFCVFELFKRVFFIENFFFVKKKYDEKSKRVLMTLFIGPMKKLDKTDPKYFFRVSFLHFFSIYHSLASNE